MDTNIQKMMRPNELAQHFNISKRTVYRMVQKRQIPFYKIVGRIRFKLEEVEKYLDSVSFEEVGREGKL